MVRVNPFSRQSLPAPRALDPVLLGTTCCIASALGYTAANVCLRILADHAQLAWAICVKESVTVALVGPWLLWRAYRGLPALPPRRALAALVLVGLAVQLIGNLGVIWAMSVVGLSVTIPAAYDQCKRTGRIYAWKLDWKPGKPNKPHPFWDSDIAKWIEAAAYSLTAHPDPRLERRVDALVDLIEEAQQPDGYLNVHFTVCEPAKRWTNLCDMHELYCAGHLMEAAVAYHEATGKRRLLDVMCRCADHIDRAFGPRKGQRRG